MIGLHVPAVQERFDLLVPMDVDIGTLTRLLTDGVRELCGGHFSPSCQETLSLRQPDMLLRPDKMLADYGVEDGAQMVLL